MIYPSRVEVFAEFNFSSIWLWKNKILAVPDFFSIFYMTYLPLLTWYSGVNFRRTASSEMWKIPASENCIILGYLQYLVIHNSQVFLEEESNVCGCSFTQTAAEKGPDSTVQSNVFNASPNSLGASPVSGFVDIEPTTLLPRSQPIPLEHATAAAPWIEVMDATVYRQNK